MMSPMPAASAQLQTAMAPFGEPTAMRPKAPPSIPQLQAVAMMGGTIAGTPVPPPPPQSVQFQPVQGTGGYVPATMQVPMASGSSNEPMRAGQAAAAPIQSTPCRYSDIRLMTGGAAIPQPSRPAPINETRIPDYTIYTGSQLKEPWHVPHSDVNRSEDWARECTVVIKSIHDDDTSETILTPIFTLGNRLPHFNHEVIAASMPIHPNGQHKGVCFIRWSSPQCANECVRLFNNTWIGSSCVRVSISQYPCKVDVNTRNRTPDIGKIFLFQWVWEMLGDAIHRGARS